MGRQITHPQLVASITVTIALSVGGSLWFQDSVRANSIQFQPPQGGAPRGTRGGASRGDAICANNPTQRHQPPFQLLTPKDSNFGLTQSDRPRFFAYIPPTQARQAMFAVKDEQGKMLHKTTVPLTGEGGIIALKLPTNAPPLAIGKNYEWGIAILCGTKLRPDSPAATAWIKRIAPPPNEHAPKSQLSLEQAAFLGRSGIWYDMLSTLVALQPYRSANPQIASAWATVLQASGFGEISTVPIRVVN